MFWKVIIVLTILHCCYSKCSAVPKDYGCEECQKMSECTWEDTTREGGYTTGNCIDSTPEPAKGFWDLGSKFRSSCREYYGDVTGMIQDDWVKGGERFPNGVIDDLDHIVIRAGDKIFYASLLKIADSLLIDDAGYEVMNDRAARLLEFFVALYRMIYGANAEEEKKFVEDCFTPNYKSNDYLMDIWKNLKICADSEVRELLRILRRGLSSRATRQLVKILNNEDVEIKTWQIVLTKTNYGYEAAHYQFHCWWRSCLEWKVVLRISNNNLGHLQPPNVVMAPVSFQTNGDYDKMVKRFVKLKNHPNFGWNDEKPNEYGRITFPYDYADEKSRSIPTRTTTIQDATEHTGLLSSNTP